MCVWVWVCSKRTRHNAFDNNQHGAKFLILVMFVQSSGLGSSTCTCSSGSQTTTRRWSSPSRSTAATSSRWEQTPDAHWWCVMLRSTSVADPGGPEGRPPLPPRFFLIMKFSGTFKGNTLFWAIFGLRPPLGSKLHWAPPDQNPGSAPVLDPRLSWIRTCTSTLISHSLSGTAVCERALILCRSKRF